jgi:hypothetical protein
MDSLLDDFHALKQREPSAEMAALVDGLVFQQVFGETLTRSPGRIALFDGTPEAALAEAGPWLIDMAQEPMLGERLLAAEPEAPIVSWLLTQLPFAGLAQLLRLRLDVELPGGRTALLRFWDPRVLPKLFDVFDGRQLDAFVEHIQRWHFLDQGQRRHIGRGQA